MATQVKYLMNDHFLRINVPELLVPLVRRLTVGARAFPVAAPALWNSLPADITSITVCQIFVIV